ncbi:S49 family peptidase [Proteiniphilum sp.]|uniref:S49 family peptidase n=1 Tax=Proteiniphilum sp. TaxID=1926877 RepID=UPI002B21FE5B|nr:S49 family peptidase [Proteiniphilum sp.]MEA4918138.1 S49 family peptidase [Proteiniphilum sp.]
MIHSSGYEILNHISNSIIDGTFTPEVIEQTIISTHGEIYLEKDDSGNPVNPFDSWTEGSIAIIPLAGIMMKYGYWWSYGVDDIASIIRMAYMSEKISGVIIKGDTPGGSTDSLFFLQEVLSNKTKPTYGFVDGMCASCGYIAFSYLDKIYAINRMARVGGIGVFARMLVPNKENAYYRVVEVIPDESKDKNLPEREAIEGNDEKMKQELSKLAIYFRGTVTSNRPGINEDTLTGKVYYAYEAEELGLIDGIRSLSQTVEELETLVAKRKEILSII